nr:dipeptidase [uncultured Oscillibacter sp.]
MSSETYEALFQDIDDHMRGYIEELCDFLRIPGVSTYPDGRENIEKAANWILEKLRGLGFEGKLRQTEGWPIVMAEHVYRSGAPRLLIYGHYDVQPEMPVDEWLTPPFEPAIRDGAVYARGANDDKGQVYTYLKALESYRRVYGEIPLNILFVIEGEEEIGSKSLLRLMREEPERLQADIFLMSDSSMLSKDIPAITCGFRGIMAMELSIQTMTKDLHSGLFGGIGLNAGEVLAGLLAKMKDRDGRITIPGFYDDVIPLTAREKEEMDKLPYDEGAVARSLGMPRLSGEAGYTAIEKKSCRPTLDINGMWCGFTGEGSKTVIPARAHAKLSSRLAPGQTPEAIFNRFEAFIRENLPRGVKAEVTYGFGALPVLVDMTDPNIGKAAEAIREGFGREAAYIRSGGTVHIVSEIKNGLKIPSLLILGWGRPENGSHSPNECFYIDDFRGAVRSLCVLFQKLANN